MEMPSTVADRRVSFNIEGINQFLKDKFEDDGFSLTAFGQDMRGIKRIFEAMEEVDKENIKKRLHEISKKWGIIDIKGDGYTCLHQILK